MNRTELANNVITASSACPEFKAAAQAFLNSPDDEKWAALAAEAKEDINTIDDTIAFFGSELAKKLFGEDVAAEKLNSVIKAKEDGAVYCNCPGCAAAEAILKAE